MLPVLLLLVLPITLLLGYMLPLFHRWCRRYAAHFTAVGAALYTATRVHAAPFYAVGVGVMLEVGIPNGLYYSVRTILFRSRYSIPEYIKHRPHQQQ